MGNKTVHEIIKHMSNELDSYKQRKIFKPQEIQKIVEQRKKYEMKLQRTKKNVADYKNYIKNEKKLLKQRNKVMEKKNIKREDTDRDLETNILRIYKNVFKMFNDNSMLEEFGSFCIAHMFLDEMKEIFSQQLLKHPEDEKSWILCSKKFWEIEDIDAARGTLIKGISIVENKKLLMVEFFKLEVMYADKLARYSREMGVEEKEYGDIERGEVAVECFKEIATKCTKIEIEQCLRISKLLPGLRNRLKEMFCE